MPQRLRRLLYITKRWPSGTPPTQLRFQYRNQRRQRRSRRSAHQERSRRLPRLTSYIMLTSAIIPLRSLTPRAPKLHLPTLFVALLPSGRHIHQSSAPHGTQRPPNLLFSQRQRPQRSSRSTLPRWQWRLPIPQSMTLSKLLMHPLSMHPHQSQNASTLASPR